MMASPQIELAMATPSAPVKETPDEILLVEDDSMSRMMFEGLLHSLGYRVKPCRDGVEALAIYSAHRYPIVITDWRLPHLDGMTLCRRISELSNGGPRTYCILVTGSLNKVLSEEAAANSGVNAFLNKPIRMQQLTEQLNIARRQLERPSLHNPSPVI